MLRRRFAATATVTALLAALVGGYVTPALASPVLATDTLRSGAGYAFGANDKGQTAPGSAPSATLGAKQLPSGTGGLLTDAVSLAGGQGFALWADHGGTVWAIGDNAYGERGNGSTGTVSATPTRAAAFGGKNQPKALKVAAFGLAALVLDSNGAVWQWGQVVSSSGSYVVSSTPAKVSFPAGTGRITDVSAGDGFALALDDSGKAYSWGRNDVGQLGLGTNSTSPSPSRITGLPVLTSGSQALVEAGRDFGVYAVSASTGVTVWTWGRNDVHQLGNGASTTDTKAPALLTTSVPAPAKALALSSGTTHTLLLTNDGAVRTWGDNGLAVSSTPTVVPDPAGLLTGGHHPYTVSAGDHASFAASTDGSVAAWGLDATGQLGRTTTGTLTQPTLVVVPGTTPVTGAGVPALITSEQGATYVVVDGEITRGPDSAGYDFGSVSTTPSAGQVAPSKVITLTDVATRALSLTSLVVDGANPGDFVLSGSTCSGTLAVDASCSVTVTFTPAAAGPRQAGLVLRTGNTLGGVPVQTIVPLTGRGYTPVAGIANLTLDLAAGQPTSVSGPGNVIPLGNLSPSLIPGSTPPTSAAPLGKIPLGKIPLGKIPLGKIPLGKVPLGKIPLGKIPLGKVPLGKVPLGKIPLGKIPLGKIPLGKIPLLRTGGWEALLQAYPALRDVPISALTLADLVDPTKTSPDATTTALPLDRVALGDLAVASSGLADLSAMTLLAGSLRLDQLSGVDLCTELPQVPNGGACTDGAGLKRYLLELDLQGVGLDTLSVGATTVGRLVTDSLSTTPSALDDAIFPDLTLASTTLAGTHVGAIALSALPSITSVLSCDPANGGTDCTSLAGRTLADAAPYLLPGATFRDLGSALNPITLAQLVEPFLDPSSFDWESLPLSSIPVGAYPNKVIEQADVDVNCLQAKGTTVGLKLPAGFQYVPGSTALTRTRGTGNVQLAEPVVDASRGLVVSIPDSSFSSTGPLACTDDSAHVRVSLKVLPGSAAGSYRATADARTGSYPALTATQATPLGVTGVTQPPDDTPDGPLAAADQLVIGQISAPDQIQYVPFLAPAGKVVEVTVASLDVDPGTTTPRDLDAVLYYPKGTRTDPALAAGTSATQVPFGEAGTVEADELHPLLTTAGGATQDVVLRTDRPVAAVAATRGPDVEQLSAVARAGDDTRHVVAVSGYNGAVGRYYLRVRLTDAPALADCTFVPPALGAAATTPFYGSNGFAAGDNTVVLVNTARIQARFPGQLQGLLDAAYAYTHSGRGGVAGQVLQVDSDPGVQAAEAARSASPCDPLASDEVVRKINAFVAPLLPSSVRYLVLTGGDDAIPHARLEDHTRDGNEREQAGELALNGGNPIAGSFAAGYFLSDDPYGTTQPTAVLGQVVYKTQVTTSRLGETPADMVSQLTAFTANDGVADPRSTQTEQRTAVVTDYDFLTAGGTDVAATLTGAGSSVDHTLSGVAARWTRTQLDAAWLSKAVVPAVAALNMHYDQYRGLPALGSATGDLSQVYDTSEVRAGPSLSKRVVFTVGCHSALDVPDGYGTTEPQLLDFAQAYAGKGLAAMVGNLGFGYADTTAVAYSARLQALFARNLAKGYDLGTALAEAKHTYLDTLAGLSSYDLKSGQQMILWGLPQTRLTSAAATVPAAPQVLPSDGTAVQSVPVQVGTQAAPLQFDAFDDQGTRVGSSCPAGTPCYYTARAGATAEKQSVSVSGKPVLPAQLVDLPEVAGRQLRSVVPSALSTLPEQPLSAAFARAAVDHDLAAEPLSSGVFPAVPSHVGTELTGPTTRRNTLVVTPASVRLDGSAPGAGTIRLAPYARYDARYGPAGPLTLPTITRVDGAYTSTGGGITSYTVDVTGNGKPISRVYVLAAPAAGSGDWVRTELLPDPGLAGRWAGAAQGRLGEFLVVALNADGDAALSNQKGAGWRPHVLSGSYPSPVSVTLSPAPPASGWYTSAPTVALPAGAPAGTLLSIDGRSGVAGPATVTGDGVHVVRVINPDGSVQAGELPVLIDSQVPRLTVSVARPVGGLPLDGTRERYQLNEPATVTATVVYGASGQASLTPASGVLPTGVVGRQVLTVVATSVAGLSSSKAYDYSVVYGKGSSGFLDPVLSFTVPGSPVGVNLVAGGSVYGFSYRLLDFAGAPVTSGATTGNSRAFTAATCPAGNKVQLPKITGETAQPVSNGGGQYTWDLTAPSELSAFSSSCDALTVTVNDGYTTFGALLTGRAV